MTIWILFSSILVLLLNVAALNDASSVATLGDHNFDQLVFPSGPDSKPYIVLFFAPWCPHCKAFKPQFENISREVREAHSDVTFAMVDATTSKMLARRYKVLGFPSLIYTIRGEGHTYHGRRTPVELREFLQRLSAAHSQRSFATLVQTPLELRAFSERVKALERVAFLFYVGTKLLDARTRAIQRANDLIDSTVSYGSSEYGILVGEGSIRETPAMHHLAVASAVGQRRVGPDGEVLLLMTDAFAGPVVFSGWNGTASELATSVDCFVRNHCDPAVSELTPQSFASLAQRGLLGIAITDGAANAAVKTTLRQVAQQRNSELIHDYAVEDESCVASDSSQRRHTTDRVVFCTMEASMFSEWVQRLGYTSKDLPTFLCFNALHEAIFRDDKTLHPILRQAWANDAALQTGRDAASTEILAFLSRIESRSVREEKFTWVGCMAKFLVDHVPLAETLHRLVGGDAELLGVLALPIFGALVFFLATRHSDEPHRRHLTPRQPASVDVKIE